MIEDPRHGELMRQFEVVIRLILNEKSKVNSLTVATLSWEEKLDLCKLGAREFALSTADSLQCYMRATAALKVINALAQIRAVAGKPITSSRMELELAETI